MVIQAIRSTIVQKVVKHQTLQNCSLCYIKHLSLWTQFRKSKWRQKTFTGSYLDIYNSCPIVFAGFNARRRNITLNCVYTNQHIQLSVLYLQIFSKTEFSYKPNEYWAVTITLSMFQNNYGMYMVYLYRIRA